MEAHCWVWLRRVIHRGHVAGLSTIIEPMTTEIEQSISVADQAAVEHGEGGLHLTEVQVYQSKHLEVMIPQDFGQGCDIVLWGS